MWSTAVDQESISHHGDYDLNELDILEELNIDDNRASNVFDGGDYFDGVNKNKRRLHARNLFISHHNINPRQYILDKIIIFGMENRPQLMGSTTINI